VFDDNAKEPLDGTQDRAMDHDRTLLAAFGVCIFKSEPFRLVEVELDGGELPFAADRIFRNEVELRTIERRFPRSPSPPRGRRSFINSDNVDSASTHSASPPRYFSGFSGSRTESGRGAASGRRRKPFDDLIHRHRLVFDLVAAAKHVCVILRDGTTRDKPGAGPVFSSR